MKKPNFLVFVVEQDYQILIGIEKSFVQMYQKYLLLEEQHRMELYFQFEQVDQKLVQKLPPFWTISSKSSKMIKSHQFSHSKLH